MASWLPRHLATCASRDVHSACGSSSAGTSCPTSRRRTRRFRVATVNANSWPTARSFLEAAGDITVACVQETRLRPDQSGDASRWAARNGWTFIGSPAVPTAASTSGRVAVLVRRSVAVCEAPGQLTWPGRSRAIHVGVGARGGVTVVCVYLAVGEGVAGNMPFLSFLERGLHYLATPLERTRGFQLPASCNGSLGELLRRCDPPPEGSHVLVAVGRHHD